jgi:nicotinamidase-related amidase
MSELVPHKDYLPEFSQAIYPDAKRTALVVIDMMYATASRTSGLGKRLKLEGRPELGTERFDRIEQVVVPHLQRLLAFCRGSGIPVIYCCLGSALPDFSDLPDHIRAAVRVNGNWVGAREHAILEEVKPEEGDIVMRKTTLSAFNSTGIEATLRALGADYVVFTGVSTNMCVDGSARDAAERGFKCLIVEDCCGAAKGAYHEAALTTFQRLFGRVVSTDEIIVQLQSAR